MFLCVAGFIQTNKTTSLYAFRQTIRSRQSDCIPAKLPTQMSI